MNCNNKVSILIPAYNSESYISSTIENILNQSFKKLEVIIVDDGSSDNTYKIAKTYESDKIKVVQTENMGACHARNLAFELSQGDYIQYIDADDLISNDKILTQMNALQYQDNPDAIATCQWRRFRQRTGDRPKENHPCFKSYDNGKEMLLDMLSGKGMMAVHSYLCPRRLIEKAGKWDERLKMNQDGEFFARVLLEAEKIIYCAEQVAWYRSGISGSITGKRTFSKCESALLALKSIADNLLKRDNSIQSKKALATAYANIAYSLNLPAPNCADMALDEMIQLGESPQIKVPMGMLILSKIFGFKSALHIKRFFMHHTRK